MFLLESRMLKLKYILRSLKNEEIIFGRILLIDNFGKKIGSMTYEEAIKFAADSKTDLSLVRPYPPVCKLGPGIYPQFQSKGFEIPFKFDPSRKVKVILFSGSIAVGDFERKIDNLREFLSGGHRCIVKVVDNKLCTSEALLQRILSELRDVGRQSANSVIDGNTLKAHVWPC